MMDDDKRDRKQSSQQYVRKRLVASWENKGVKEIIAASRVVIHLSFLSFCFNTFRFAFCLEFELVSGFCDGGLVLFDYG